MLLVAGCWTACSFAIRFSQKKHSRQLYILFYYTLYCICCAPGRLAGYKCMCWSERLFKKTTSTTIV
jgi:hypothetical protein